VLFTPGKVISAEPSKSTPPIFFVAANFVAVAASVAVSALPVTSPVKSPVNVPENVPVPVIVGDVKVLFVNV